MDNRFKTETSTLQNLAEKRFVIPTYQRPYVWGEEQINKLLDDFYDARNDAHYYVGTILLYKQEENKTIYQLIDGQQRFTTLWLVASAFKMLNSKSKILDFLKVGDELRLDFTIRKQIKAYLLSLLEKSITDKSQYSDSEIEKDEYLAHIAKAITTIVSYLQTKFNNDDLRDTFGDFIYKQVQFVCNTVPEHSDLNKLFAVINNSGIQLEQSDILKSLLLKNIKTDKALYSRIWEACENMNNYFERNVKQLFLAEFEWNSIQYDALSKAPDKTQEQGSIEMQKQVVQDYSIEEILSNSIICGQDEKKILIEYQKDQKDADNLIFCRSIITFPQLLLHAYRIFLKQQGEEDFELPFHTKNLLQIFKLLVEKDEQVIKDFFRCLWKVRFVFDKEVVKWIQQEDDKEEVLLLSTISTTQENYFTRTHKEKSDASMLQSVLYFTGNYNTQIWLTPYLKRLIDGEDSLTCLESIDNKLSSSTLADKDTSFALMDKTFPISDKFDFEAYLKEPNGTSFRHYWFQKLEYILWKEFKIADSGDNMFKNYRITSKNSVEHVFPQNHEFEDRKAKDSFPLHDFGNLALLNVGQNSSYSNQDVGKKKIDFKGKPVYDSLKLKLIYDVQNWDEKAIETHREAMIEKIRKHYEKI